MAVCGCVDCKSQYSQLKAGIQRLRSELQEVDQLIKSRCLSGKVQSSNSCSFLKVSASITTSHWLAFLLRQNRAWACLNEPVAEGRELDTGEPAAASDLDVKTLPLPNVPEVTPRQTSSTLTWNDQSG